MCRNRSNPQANFCNCLVADRNPIKERNSHLPVYLESDRTGPTEVSQRHLRNTYPVIFGDLRRSGNRAINPIDRQTPFFTSHRDYDQCARAAELIISTLRNKPCLSPICPGYGYDPILEAHLDRVKEAALLGDPIMFEAELQRSLQLFDGFAVLAGSLGRNDSLSPRLNPSFRNKGGLGPGIDLLVRDMALRFMPSFADGGPAAVFAHIGAIHRLSGNDTQVVRRLIEDLRVDEKRDLLQYLVQYADLLAESGEELLVFKIIRILESQPADVDEMIAHRRHMGY